MTSSARDLERDSAIYKTLLESTQAIPWRVDWHTKEFTYIGPQIEALLGWTRDSWVSVNDWADRMHPEDRERVVEFCFAQSQIGCDHEAAYRARARDGSYVWIRDVVHVIRNESAIEALIGFMIEIGEDQRRAEGLSSPRLISRSAATSGVRMRNSPWPAIETDVLRRKPFRDPLIGQLVEGRYRIEKRIGKGGMGIVYLAEHVLLQRKVALKTLCERACASHEMVARFKREATAAAAIGNAHVVGVTDMGQLDDGSDFVVLEYLEGIELAHAVATSGTFSLARALHVTMQLCDALSAVHAAGIVHRDLKPENLFLVERDDDRDFVKVLDFGVCKLLERVPGEEPLTHTGEAIGTPQHMAPEQIESPAAVDVRTDVYATGAILYYALTGSAPFDGATLPRLLMRICSEPPPPLRASRPDLSPALEAVIALALERRPELRYQSSAELRRALEAFVT
jgi:PAS domain S-box-containing protein